jgi:DNA repair exonuclease SbcCD ATPase subunit
MGQTERKDLLCQFIGLNMFDKLVAKGNDKLKELTGAIKSFNKENNQVKIESNKNDLGLAESKLIDLTGQRDQYLSKKNELDNKIVEQQAKIIKLENVPTNVVALKKERETLETKNSQAVDAISVIDTNTESKKKEYVDASNKLSAFPDDLKEKSDKHASFVRQKTRLEQELEKFKVVVKEKLKKIEHLSNHKYDPNCEYCCDNAFVKDAISAKNSLESDKTDARELFDAISTIKTQIIEVEPFVTQYEQSVLLKETINTLTAFISKKELEKSNLNNLISKNSNRIVDIDNLVELYEKSKEIVESNKIVEVVLSKLKDENTIIVSKLKNIEREYVDAYSRKVSLTDQIKNIEEQIKKIEEHENELAAYQYYLTSIGKDGVPYKIISDAIPRIEQDVNNILSQMVEFSMGIETDGKNVNVYIKYDDKKWPLELCSGMEKFVSALALRVSLINISNLPRSNFLVVDEGMSALDASNLPMLHTLFDYLKSSFDFIIIISHLDAMRDMVDKQLEIKKENGFSKIDNSV